MILAILRKIRMWGPRGVLDFFRRKVVDGFTCMEFRRNARRYKEKSVRGITVIANLSAKTSLSKTMRDFVTMLRKAGIPYQTYDLNPNRDEIPASDVEGIVTPRNEFRILKYDHIVEMFGGPFLKGFQLKRSRLIFWEFESGLLEYYPAIADGVDEIIGMSDFDVDVFRKLLPDGTKVQKILYPFLLDVGELTPSSEVRAKYGLGQDEFVVFFNFDFGSSFNRKNPDGALQAFAGAFRGVPGTRLVFKTKGAKSHPADLVKLTDLAAQLGVSGQVVFINSFIPMKDIYGLTNACDVYLSLHRGEGFGLGIAEAMSLGKPVVVTDYSATTEFCRKDNSIPVPYKMVSVPPSMHDHVCYRAVREWAEPDVDAAASALKQLYNDADLRKRLGEKAELFVANHFSVENFKKSVDEFLSGRPALLR